MTPSALRWRADKGRLQRVGRAAYVESDGDATTLETALAMAMAARGVNGGLVAATLLELDSPPLRGAHFVVSPSMSGRRDGAHRYALDPARRTEVDGIPITDGLQTLLDLAAYVSDDVWEQILESVLRKKLTAIAEIETALVHMGRARTKGVRRIRRVLARRPPSAPATESMLETLMVQLARDYGVPTPTRQLEIYEHGVFVARPDLCWPELGVFIELDGQQHKGQPVYDANRETRIVAATGWLCARFTWDEVHRTPKTSARRLMAVLEQARLRPVAR